MSSPAVFATPEAGILEVMEMLVAKGISGLPICSERACSLCCTGAQTLPCVTRPRACTGDDGHVLGIVSGYDLLAVDSTPGRLDASLDANYLFPPVNLYVFMTTYRQLIHHVAHLNRALHPKQCMCAPCMQVRRTVWRQQAPDVVELQGIAARAGEAQSYVCRRCHARRCHR